MKIGPKYKICKRLGSAVFEKCQTQKYQLSEERRSKSRRGGRPRAPSDFGRQLLEKQKVRYTYGVSERQLSRYVREAAAQKTSDPMQALVGRLEARLDNTVYRAGLASTRRLARQMVSHGHLTVNGRRVTVPSYEVKKGDVLAIREGSRDKKLFESLEEKMSEHQSVSWVNFDPKKKIGAITADPAIPVHELPFDTSVVLEYYSR